jgi:hypothetical protein
MATANNSIVIDYEERDYREQARKHVHNLPVYTKEYFRDLFPIFQWIHKYNLTVSKTGGYAGLLKR